MDPHASSCSMFSGIIHLETHIVAKHRYTTIAGQTAPAPGIMLEGADLVVNVSDVLIQHIHSRPGAEHPERPALDQRSGFQVSGFNTTGISNVVLDHVSVAWSPEMSFLTWSDTPEGFNRDITISNSILAEGLRYTPHPKPDPVYGHSTGPLFGKNSQRISMIRDISAFNRWRNPLVRSSSTDIQIVNNFIYWPAPYERARLLADIPDWTITASMRGNVDIFARDRNSSRRNYFAEAFARKMRPTR